ncbi:CENP-S associating centromere protein X-domain-containing protein [Astrocystis sublimbata]|nr:CENP-S associating centromere protein X-domain-containing protein [Astrocystis sublimbata]
MAPPRPSTNVPRGARGSSGASTTSKAPKTASSRSHTQSSRPPQPSHSDQSDLDPFADDEPPPQPRGKDCMDVDENGDDEDNEAKKTIPPELLTRILHEFFEKDGTRISKDANKAVAQYMDVFVREAIARTAREKGHGFLEVEDLEKVAPQLLMDL